MGNLEGFDARKVEPNTVNQPLPAGEYAVVIESSEIKPTKSGEGKYLELVLQVIDGEHKGRKLWDRLNIWNKNEQAVQIAQGTLSAICRSIKVDTPDDSSELHDKPLSAVVKCREYNGNIQNEVKGYSSISKAKKPAKAKAAATTENGTVEKAPWD